MFSWWKSSDSHGREGTHDHKEHWAGDRYSESENHFTKLLEINKQLKREYLDLDRTEVELTKKLKSLKEKNERLQKTTRKEKFGDQMTFNQIRKKDSNFEKTYGICVNAITELMEKRMKQLLLQNCPDGSEISEDANVCKAYGLLLSACHLKGKGNYERIIEHGSIKDGSIMEHVCDKYDIPPDHYQKLHNPIDNALALASKMVVLLPPLVVRSADGAKYDEEWMESHYSTWDDEGSKESVMCYRPATYHGGTNTVSVLAQVGNVQRFTNKKYLSDADSVQSNIFHDAVDLGNDESRQPHPIESDKAKKKSKSQTGESTVKGDSESDELTEESTGRVDLEYDESRQIIESDKIKNKGSKSKPQTGESTMKGNSESDESMARVSVQTKKNGSGNAKSHAVKAQDKKAEAMVPGHVQRVSTRSTTAAQKIKAVHHTTVSMSDYEKSKK